MKRQLTSILLFSALLVGGASTFVSCTDHESDSAYNTSVSLADAIAQQKAKLEALNTELAQKVDQTTYASDKQALEARIAANEGVIAGLEDNYVSYGKLNAAIEASEAYQGLKSEIAAVEKLRAKDSLAFVAMDSALQAKIDTLGTQVNSIEEMQDKMKTALDFLVNKNLSNIAINATENPVTGYWNAAFLGSQLNLISSFYGVAADGTDEWGDIIKPNQVLGKNGNAGYIYVSLNPTELDPSLVQVELVNSQGEPAKGFKLGAIENTDKVLTYGYTRATSKNGFYQIPVIASDPQNDDFALDKGSLKEAAQNILGELKNPKGNDFDLTKVAAALYKNNLNNKLTAYTVKATYYLYDAEKGEMVKKTQVAPAYNLAAFAIKPVSFNFLKDNANLDKLSGWAVENFRLPSLSSKLGKFMDALNFQIKNENGKQIKMYSMLSGKNVAAYEDGDDVILVNTTTGDKFTLPNTKISKDFSGFKYDNNIWERRQEVYYDEFGMPHYTVYLFPIENLATENYERVYVFETTDNTVDELITSINGQIAGKLQPIKNVLSNVNSKWENVIAKVNPLLKKVSSKIGSANKMLQPTILYMDQNGNPNTLSTLGGRLGTRFVGLGSTNLYATSWTAELLAPAYLKSVYVVEDGAEVTLADGKTSAKTPFNGTRLIFTAKKTGKYTIVYKALDYSGLEVEKTFNVEVVK